MKKLLLLGFTAVVIALAVGFNASRIETPNVKNSVIEQPRVEIKVLTPEDIDIEKLWALTNAERTKAGSPTVTLSQPLNSSSKLKCDDMVTRDYFEHNTPEGKEPWVFIEQSNIDYDTAGENLANGFDSAESVVVGWMKSPGHKRNLLDPTYSEVGFNVCKSDNFIAQGSKLVVVQHFIAK